MVSTLCLEALSIGELAYHKHKICAEYGCQGVSDFVPWITYTQLSGESAGTKSWSDICSEAIGENKPHNILQPYISVYMWQRTL